MEKYKKLKKKWIRKCFALLPVSLRYRIIRSSIVIDPQWPEFLEIKIASDQNELESAYRLLHNSYVECGFMKPTASGMRVIPQHLLPQTSTIVAKWKGRVIGTVSLIRDNPMGLPMDKAFDLNSRRNGVRRLAEVSSLALDPEFRGKCDWILFPLFRFVYHYARLCFGVHEFVIAVNPKMVDLYRALLLFEKLNNTLNEYDFVNGAPAEGLYLNLEDAESVWKKVYQRSCKTQNMWAYYQDQESLKRQNLPERDYLHSNDPVITPRLMSEFFLSKADLKNHLTQADVRILIRLYPSIAYQDILHSLVGDLENRNLLHEPDSEFRTESTFDTHMPAKIQLGSIRGEVWSVSRSKLLWVCSDNVFQIGDQIDLNVQIGRNIELNIQTEVLSISQSQYELKIIVPNLKWIEMIKSLEKRHQISDLEQGVKQFVVAKIA